MEIRCPKCLGWMDATSNQCQSCGTSNPSFADYISYLKSEKWRALRKAAYRRAIGKCEFCGSLAANIHHVRYPKNYSEDSVENLVAVCKRCHDLGHGIRAEIVDPPCVRCGEATAVYIKISEPDAAAYGQVYSLCSKCVGELLRWISTNYFESVKQGGATTEGR